MTKHRTGTRQEWLAARLDLLKVGPGWHMHLDVLVARATGKEPEPFWDGWMRLKADYERRLPPTIE